MSVVRYLLFGVGIWAIPFVIGMAIFPLADPATALFDTIMSIAMSGAAGWLSWLYLKGRDGNGFAAGATAGLGWAAIAVALDAPLFLFGPFLMPPADYFADIGLAYLMIPLIAGFVGLALRR
jgi:hypothetical protein